jgi:hypothetical protein
VKSHPSVHLSGELFKAMTGITMQHVPYRGTAAAMSSSRTNREVGEGDEILGRKVGLIRRRRPNVARRAIGSSWAC